MTDKETTDAQQIYLDNLAAQAGEKSPEVSSRDEAESLIDQLEEENGLNPEENNVMDIANDSDTTDRFNVP